jgi:hypothetical protein
VGSEFNKEATWALPCSHPVYTAIFTSNVTSRASSSGGVEKPLKKNPHPSGDSNPVRSERKAAR